MSGQTVDVKAVATRTHNLIAPANKQPGDARIYVLAFVDAEARTAEFLGWAWARDLLHPSRRRDLGYGLTYVLEQAALKPIPPVWMPK